LKSRLLKYHSETKLTLYLFKLLCFWLAFFFGNKIRSIDLLNTPILSLAYKSWSTLGSWASSKTATSQWKSLSSRSKSFHYYPDSVRHCIMLFTQGLASTVSASWLLANINALQINDLVKIQDIFGTLFDTSSQNTFSLALLFLNIF
jgi:hypothetical protein